MTGAAYRARVHAATIVGVPGLSACGDCACSARFVPSLAEGTPKAPVQGRTLSEPIDTSRQARLEWATSDLTTRLRPACAHPSDEVFAALVADIAGTSLRFWEIDADPRFARPDHRAPPRAAA